MYPAYPFHLTYLPYVTSWGLYFVFVIFESTWLTSAYRTYFLWVIEEGKLQLETNNFEGRAIGAFIGSELAFVREGEQQWTRSERNIPKSSWIVNNHTIITEWFISLIIVAHVLLFMGGVFVAIGMLIHELCALFKILNSESFGS